MKITSKIEMGSAARAVLVALAFVALPAPGSLGAQEAFHDDLTFTRDIAPILQRSCQTCHREGGVAPMSLATYQQVRRYSSRIVYRTGLRDVAGAMPPWYVEKDIGIQHFKNDPSLTDEEVARISAWVENGMPEGDPADMPAPRVFPNDEVWIAGEPDLIVKTKEIFVEGGAPDWWGEIESVPIGLTEDGHTLDRVRNLYYGSSTSAFLNYSDPKDHCRDLLKSMLVCLCVSVSVTLFKSRTWTMANIHFCQFRSLELNSNLFRYS